MNVLPIQGFGIDRSFHKVGQMSSVPAGRNAKVLRGTGGLGKRGVSGNKLNFNNGQDIISSNVYNSKDTRGII